MRIRSMLFRKSDRHQKASECYRKSLKLNSFLWSSFEALCRLGKHCLIRYLSYDRFSSQVNASIQVYSVHQQ